MGFFKKVKDWFVGATERRNVDLINSISSEEFSSALRTGYTDPIDYEAGEDLPRKDLIKDIPGVQ